MVIKCLVSGLNCLQFGFASNPGGKASHAFLELSSLPLTYVIRLPKKAAMSFLSISTTSVMYIQSHETLTIP